MPGLFLRHGVEDHRDVAESKHALVARAETIPVEKRQDVLGSRTAARADDQIHIGIHPHLLEVRRAVGGGRLRLEIETLGELDAVTSRLEGLHTRVETRLRLDARGHDHADRTDFRREAVECRRRRQQDCKTVHGA